MKKTLLIHLVLFSVYSLFAANVTGTVYDRTSQQPINNAWIAVYQINADSTETEIGFDLTGSDGLFSINNLPDNVDAHLIALHNSYQREDHYLYLFGDFYTDVPMTAAQLQYHSIQGQVTDSETGMPLDSINVHFHAGGTYQVTAVSANGQYSMPSVWASTLNVYAFANNDQYLPYVSEIEVTEDGTYDIVMVPASESDYVLYGTVRHGYALDNCGNVRLSGTQTSASYSCPINSKGVYRFNNVPDGNYYLSVETPENAFSFCNEETNSIVSVSSSNFQCMNLSYSALPKSVISGIVEDENGIPVGRRQIKAVRIDMIGNACNTYGHFQAISSFDGGFSMNLPHGKYILYIVDAPNSTTFLKNTDSEETAVMNVDSDIDNIRFVIRPHAASTGTVSGTVTSVEGLNAECLPIVFAKETVTGSVYSTETNLDGSYLIEVPAGTYKLSAMSAKSYLSFCPSGYRVENAGTVPVSEGCSLNSLDITLEEVTSIGKRTVSGYICDDANNPVAGADVFVLSISGDVLGYTFSDANGYYIIKNVMQNSAYVNAGKMGYQRDSLNIEFLGDASADIQLIPESSVNTDNMVNDFTGYNLMAYPNPFNPETAIHFSLPQESSVELTVYNVKGQKIVKLLTARLDKGEHSVRWRGHDESGKNVGSGVYFYKLMVNGKTECINKCVLLK